MELKQTIYSSLKHNTSLLNFILFFIVKTVIESIDHLILAIKNLISKFELRTAIG